MRAIGPRYLISAVARIYKPGCQVDHMLVLEGPQGKQKSTALRTLAVRDAWFTDRLSHVASKDAVLEMAGVIIVETAEMDTLFRASSSATKSFLTRRDDRFRPPYGKHPIRLKRQCVFAGSINPPANGYLKDPTGARRFWPVTCHGMIDRAHKGCLRHGSMSATTDPVAACDPKLARRNIRAPDGMHYPGPLPVRRVQHHQRTV